MSACLRVLDALDLELEYIYADAGLTCYRGQGTYLPETTIAAIKASDACLFGAVTSPITAATTTSDDIESYTPVIPTLRKKLDLYVNLRPFDSRYGYRYSPIQQKAEPLDIVLVRENLEGLYTGVEYETGNGSAVITERKISRRACERICRYAFEYAWTHGRSRISCIHKANVLRKSDGLFKQVFYELAHMYSGRSRKSPESATISRKLIADDYYVDRTAMELILHPEKFDVIVTLNLYGDILSDLLAALIGGLGFAPSANLGDTHAIFEPVHGSAPDIAGKGVANPTGMILAGAMMLSYIGYDTRAEIIKQALASLFVRGVYTHDVGGNYSTTAFTEEIVRELRKKTL
jgi:isocitrate/isopropylmalate dehydrogenase